LVVDKTGAVHRLDRRLHRFSVPSEPSGQAAKTIGVRRRGASLDRPARLIDELDREIDSCESELRREPARFSVYRWVVRCCRGCGLRSGCVGLPWPVSSCNRCEPDRV
jgi:hypothetical protein